MDIGKVKAGYFVKRVRQFACEKQQRDATMSDSTITITQAGAALQEAAVIQDGRGFPNPYSKVERIRRALWVVVNAMLYRPVPRWLKGWHITWLRLFGARLGRGTGVHPSAEIYFPCRLQTADFSLIGNRVIIY